MGWYYRPPANFPAFYPHSLREAALTPSIPTIVAATPTTKEINAIAETYRWFRWCIRSEPMANKELSSILENYEIRTSIETTNLGSILYVTAKPTKVSEFIRLNPELAGEVLPECQ